MPMADFAVQRTVMVDTQVRPSDVTKFPVIEAMLAVPREMFVPESARETAYRDGQIGMGSGRAMLEPRAFAKMLDAVDIQPTELVLDLGCGLGYSSAVVARMTEAVIAVEEDADMAREAEARLAQVEADNVAVFTARLNQGAGKHGPFDAVLVEGGVETVPCAIMDQVKEGGRIAAVFIEGPVGVCRVGHRRGSSVAWRDAFNAAAPVLPGFERPRKFRL